MKVRNLVLTLAATASVSALAYPIEYNERSMPCLRTNEGRVCMQDTVVGKTNNDYIGTVTEIFADGQVSVRMTRGSYNGSQFNLRVENLAAEVPCYGNVCTHGLVINRNNDQQIGSVTTVFANGLTSVQMTMGPYNGSTLMLPAQNLAIQVECMGEICTGQDVIGRTNSQYVGRVQSMFENGRARVTMTQGPYNGSVLMLDVSNLSARLAPLAPGYGPGNGRPGYGPGHGGQGYGPGPRGPVFPGPVVVVPGQGPRGPGRRGPGPVVVVPGNGGGYGSGPVVVVPGATYCNPYQCVQGSACVNQCPVYGTCNFVPAGGSGYYRVMQCGR